MSFSTKLASGGGRVIETSQYTTQDPLVKINYVPKGNNVIFGGTPFTGSPKNLLFLGKVIEVAQGKNLLGADAWLDVKFPHVIYVTGTRGSGKSFDLGVLIEGLSALKSSSGIQEQIEPVASILLDMQSQFWTLRFPPRAGLEQSKKHIEDLARWNIQSNALADCQIYVPPNGERFLGDEKILTIKPKDVTQEDWCRLLGQPIYSPQGHLIGDTLRALAGQAYSIQDMISHISAASNFTNIPDASKSAVTYRLDEYNQSGLFDRDGLEISELLISGRCSVLMLRDLRDTDKSLVAALVARRLFTAMGEHHKKLKIAEFFGSEVPATKFPSKVWLLVDEAHVVAPKDVDSPAREALIEFVKRGRDAGLSLVLATQQPSAVDDRILSQVNLSFNHRLAFQSDIAAAIGRVPTRPTSTLKISGVPITDFGDMLRLLEVGECFIGDAAASRTVMLQVRPRVTAHGGYSPV